jgi:hypothetical protein
VTPAASIASDWSTMGRAPRPAGAWKLGRGRFDGAVQFLEAAASVAPLVGVAHQDGRHLLRPPVDRLQDGAHLPPPPQAGQIQVHADDAQWPIADQQLRHHRAARFQHGQLKDGDVHHLDMFLHQQGIAVPAKIAGIDLEQPLRMLAAGQTFQRTAVPDAKRNRLVQAMIVDQIMLHRCAAPADALVGFLQGNHVGVDFL